MSLTMNKRVCVDIGAGGVLGCFLMGRKVLTPVVEAVSVSFQSAGIPVWVEKGLEMRFITETKVRRELRELKSNETVSQRAKMVNQEKKNTKFKNSR